MISELEIEKNSQKYFQLFEKAHLEHKQKIRQLQNKIHIAASKIQKIFRTYILKKKTKCAIKIQKNWKKKLKSLRQYKRQIMKFKKNFYIGKIVYFLRKKLKIQNTSSKMIQIKQYKGRNNKDRIINRVISEYPKYICLRQALFAENAYINKLKVYQEKSFSSTWKKYEQSLIKQIKKQITKKWIKKTEQIYINKEDRQINVKKYIQTQLNKVYQVQYEKFMQHQLTLSKTTQVIFNALQNHQSLYLQNMYTKL